MKFWPKGRAALAAIALACWGCASSAPGRGASSDPAEARSLSKPWTAWRQSGLATYYASSLAGHRTASGEKYDPFLLTAAHRELPFGTLVEVRRRDGRRSVVVRINDRGPFGTNRVIDLSYRAAEALGIVHAGKTMVEIYPYGSDRSVPPARASH